MFFGIMRMDTKISVKVGTIEVEYEGEASFLTHGLNDLLLNLSNILAATPQFITKSQLENTNEIIIDQKAHETRSNNFPQMSTSNIAARLPAKSAKDLVLCAMANLQLVKKQEKQKRQYILTEMQTATSYYKQTMAKNLTRTLDSLLKSKEINEIGKDEYSLSAATVKKFEVILADDE